MSTLPFYQQVARQRGDSAALAQAADDVDKARLAYAVAQEQRDALEKAATRSPGRDRASRFGASFRGGKESDKTKSRYTPKTGRGAIAERIA